MNGDFLHDEAGELLGAYALDALDRPERDAIERHLAGCPRCRAEVMEHREVAAMLAHTGGEAPADVWNRITGALEERPPALRLVPVPPPRPRRRRLAVVVAVAAAVAVVVGGVAVHEVRRIDQLDAALAGDALERAAITALADPRARTVDLRATDRDLAVRVAVRPDGTAFLAAAALPGLAAGRTYQLWILRGAEKISAGILGRDPGVVAFRVAAPVDGFAITDEVAGGVVQTSNRPLVAGFLS